MIKGSLNIVSEPSDITYPYYIASEKGQLLPVSKRSGDIWASYIGNLYCDIDYENTLLSINSVRNCKDSTSYVGVLSIGNTVGIDSMIMPSDYSHAEVKVLVMVLKSICTYRTSITAAAAKSVLFPFMTNYMSSCTYGKMLMYESNFAFVDINTPIPCQGNFSWFTFDATKSCSGSEYYSWAMMAEDEAQRVYNLDVKQFQHRALIIPDIGLCPWAGLGSVGCGSSCYMWIKASSYNPSTFLHEFGHNIGLHHASTMTEEYGDFSCIMGGGGSMRCFNAFHKHRMGWTNPLYSVDTSIEWTQFRIMSLSTTSNAGYVIIRVNETSGIMVSYKEPTGPDTTMYKEYANKVLIHIFTKTAMLSQANRARLVMMITDLGEIKTLDSVQVRLDFKGVGYIDVSIRKTSGSGGGGISNTPRCGDGACAPSEIGICYIDCPDPRKNVIICNC